MNTSVYVNGTITDGKSATISVLDHGFLYGEGVYETLRTYHRRPFLLTRHLKRLRASAEKIDLPILQEDNEITDSIFKTMNHAALDCEQYIRILITRGFGELSYDPSTCPKPTLVIIVKPHSENSPDTFDQGIPVITSSVIRNHPLAINPLIKSNNLLNNALAMQEAIRRGAQEALMKNYRGEISECAQSNFFLVREGIVNTPPLESGLLEGVTRNFVFEVAKEIGIATRESVLNAEDLGSAEEMFITSTTREVVPVTQLDNQPVGSGSPGPITKKLASAFRSKAEAITLKFSVQSDGPPESENDSV